jgi:deoxyuridine 5'-triphosphate nucleotidohydrolase
LVRTWQQCILPSPINLLYSIIPILLLFTAPRSGLAVKNFIDVGAGVVDYDYRGNVGVVLFNHGEEDFAVARGDRVAQLVLERISMAGVTEVQELAETARGAGGFGSTGVVGGVAVGTAGDDVSTKRAKVETVAVEVMEVKKLTDLAIIPVRGSAFAAGFDLSSAYDLVVPKKGKSIVKTDLAIAIPENTYARIGEFDVPPLMCTTTFCLLASLSNSSLCQHWGIPPFPVNTTSHPQLPAAAWP